MSGIIPLRTDHQKFQSYYGDCGGRDTYIITGFGGLIKEGAKGATCMGSPYTGFQTPAAPTALYINQGNQLRRSIPYKETTCMSYFGDGTGRDSYVIADYGGLVRKYQHKGFI